MLKFHNPLPLIREYKSAILLGVGSALWCIFNIHFIFGLLLFLSGVPIFFSYLSYGQKSGFISAVFTTILMFAFVPFEISIDVFLNIIMPSSVIGHLALRNIVKNRKKWWYPESFLLNNFVFLFAFVMVIMSFTLRTEESMTKIYEEAVKIIFSENASFYINGAGQNLRSVIKYYEGIATFYNMLATILNLQIAYILGRKFKTNIRTSFDVFNITISPWLSILPLVALTLSKILPSLAYVFCGLFVVGLFAPTLSGFSVVGFIAKKRKIRRAPLVITALIIIFPLHIITLISLLGIVDSFYPVRKKLTGA